MKKNYDAIDLLHYALARKYLPQPNMFHFASSISTGTGTKSDLGQLHLLKHHYFSVFQRQFHTVELMNIHMFKIPSERTKLEDSLRSNVI